jgi:hypothetical protein
MSAQELTNAIAKHNQKRLLGTNPNQLPKRCAFHAMCGQAPVVWAWHTYLRKRKAVCQRCFDTNHYLVPAKPKK